MSTAVYLTLTLGGFVTMVIGVILGFISVWGMISALNSSAGSVQVPKWHAFVRFLSNDVINRYSAAFGKKRLPWQFLRLCWTLMGFGFALVIGASIASR